jgi:hypothetical protein
MARPITAETRQKNRIRDLERIVADTWPSVLLEADVWQYIEALSPPSTTSPTTASAGQTTSAAPSPAHTAAQHRHPRPQLVRWPNYNAERAHLKRTRCSCTELDRLDGAKAQDVA